MKNVKLFIVAFAICMNIGSMFADRYDSVCTLKYPLLFEDTLFNLGQISSQSTDTVTLVMHATNVADYPLSISYVWIHANQIKREFIFSKKDNILPNERITITMKIYKLFSYPTPFRKTLVFYMGPYFEGGGAQTCKEWGPMIEGQIVSK